MREVCENKKTQEAEKKVYSQKQFIQMNTEKVFINEAICANEHRKSVPKNLGHLEVLGNDQTRWAIITDFSKKA